MVAKRLAAVLIVLTPLLGAADRRPPRINGPRVFGVRPGHPVLFTISATGGAPLHFRADGLPAGLSLDSRTGRISGRLARAGEYRIRLGVRNADGTASREFTIKAGDTLALTPPMGWSSWYCARTGISDRYIRSQAEAMVSIGMAAHGYSYIHIDDGWNMQPGSTDPALSGPPRDDAGNMRPNRNFPDMKALADFVHAKGLKFGIYSSPGPLTCGKFEGSLGHEEQDARQFAAWEIDLLKYDWCSYKNRKLVSGPEEWQQPYRLMSGLLARQNRDILLNICQYGLGEVERWGRAAGGHFWRSGDDIGWVFARPMWESVERWGFSLAGKEPWAGPGGWNDPDNILIGHVVLSTNKGRTPLGPVPMSLDEQRTYVSLWSIAAAPLMFGGDMTRLDADTIGLLTNDEVIDVNQDPLGRQAAVVAKDGLAEVWAKDLEDGSKVVGLFNRGGQEAEVKVRWSDLKLSGPRSVRDLWKHQDLGPRDVEFIARVAPHGVVLVRLAAAR